MVISVHSILSQSYFISRENSLCMYLRIYISVKTIIVVILELSSPNLEEKEKDRYSNSSSGVRELRLGTFCGRQIRAASLKKRQICNNRVFKTFVLRDKSWS